MTMDSIAEMKQDFDLTMDSVAKMQQDFDLTMDTVAEMQQKLQDKNTVCNSWVWGYIYP